jgi:ferredoxin
MVTIMTVKVDKDRCMGSGACVFECPEVFAQDKTGIVVLLTDRPEEGLRHTVQAAAAACPVACISVEED